jgi:cytochrome P450 family 110
MNPPKNPPKNPSLNQPPTVKAHPFLQMLGWTFNPLGYLEDCARRYGDCFIVRIGNVGPKCVFMSHPQGIADLFAPGNSKDLDAGRGQIILKLVLGSNSSMLLDGKEHQRHRQLIMPSLHGDRMRAYGDIICQVTEQITEDWVPGQQVTLHPVLCKIALPVILKTIFGLQATERSQLLSQRIRKYLDTFNSPLVYLIAFFPILQRDWGSWSPYSKFVTMMAELDELMFEEICDRRANPDPEATDVLSMLVQARDEAGEAMTDQELRDELFTLLFAGYDSSAAVFSWVFHYVHANPTVKEKLLAELDSLGDDPTPSQIVKLPYLTAVCNESMRLRSAVPASTPRITNRTISLQGYEFPPETVIVPVQHLTHHRPDLYADPQQFNPDRFLDRRYSSSEFYPYGGGARYCTGAAFASYEMKLILATLLRRYQLELVDQRPIQTTRRGVNIAPKGGVKMIMKGTRIPTKPAPLAVAH